MNLSGMIAGRMEARLAEMGIRKSFGATRRRLLSQVLAGLGIDTTPVVSAAFTRRTISFSSARKAASCSLSFTK